MMQLWIQSSFPLHICFGFLQLPDVCSIFVKGLVFCRFFEQKRRKEERIARAREEEAKGKQKRHDKRHEKSVEAVRRRIRRAEMVRRLLLHQ
jgi:F0F1-type ATP synthase epsilon subunit